MASELTQGPTTTDANSSDAAPITAVAGGHPDITRPAPPVAGPGRSTRRGRVVLVAVSGLLTGLVLLATLLTGWSGRRVGDGLVLVLAITALMVLLVAVPIIALSVRTMRGAKALRTAHEAGTGWQPIEPAAMPGEPASERAQRAMVLTDQADVVAACDTALASRDLVGGEVALVVLDVMGLERIQTQLGPSGVNDVARQTVRRLRAWLPPQDSVAQLGTSSFAVLIEGLGTEGAAPQVARLTALLGEPMASRDQVVEVEFAVGTAESDADSTGTEMLLRAVRAAAVDSARHAAPPPPAATVPAHSFRQPATRRPRPVPMEPAEWAARTAVVDEAHSAESASPLAGVGRLAAELRTSLRQWGLKAAFRPIIRLDDESERMIAIQAIPRWTSPGGQVVPPDQLEALAAQSGLSVALGRQLLERGLDAVAAWYAAGFAVGRLAVTMSQEELSDQDLPGRVGALLARRQLPGSCLVVEVDAASVSDGTTVRPALTRLREQGAEVILTGVVTPQAALGLLTTLPLSGISLHRSLTAVLPEHPVPATATVANCHQLGLRTVAEHVSSAVQLRAARECGIDAAWGPAIASPARARDISARYSAARSLALRG